MAPLFGIAVLEDLCALADRHTCGFEPGFQCIDLDGFPQPEVHRIVGLIITVLQIDEMMGPHLTPLCGIIQIGDLVKMLAMMSQQCIIDAQYALRLHLCTSKTR